MTAPRPFAMIGTIAALLCLSGAAACDNGEPSTDLEELTERQQAAMIEIIQPFQRDLPYQILLPKYLPEELEYIPLAPLVSNEATLSVPFQARSPTARSLPAIQRVIIDQFPFTSNELSCETVPAYAQGTADCQELTLDGYSAIAESVPLGDAQVAYDVALLRDGILVSVGWVWLVANDQEYELPTKERSEILAVARSLAPLADAAP